MQKERKCYQYADTHTHTKMLLLTKWSTNLIPHPKGRKCIILGSRFELNKHFRTESNDFLVKFTDTHMIETSF